MRRGDEARDGGAQRDAGSLYEKFNVIAGVPLRRSRGSRGEPVVGETPPNAPTLSNSSSPNVEDDDGVAEATAELLRDIGFQAVRVRDGKAALPALDRNSTIKLVMSDIVMPGGMSGLELARALREGSDAGGDVRARGSSAK